MRSLMKYNDTKSYITHKMISITFSTIYTEMVRGVLFKPEFWMHTRTVYGPWERVQAFIVIVYRDNVQFWYEIDAGVNLIRSWNGASFSDGEISIWQIVI